VPPVETHDVLSRLRRRREAVAGCFGSKDH
jgi:hypothetical protein